MFKCIQGHELKDCALPQIIWNSPVYLNFIFFLKLLWILLKVSKFQNQIFLFSFESKNEQNYFLIFALASNNGLNQKNEGSLIYSLRGI